MAVTADQQQDCKHASASASVDTDMKPNRDTDADMEVDRDAEILYEYHQLHMPIDGAAVREAGADAIFCLCSLDTRVAERAAQLFLDASSFSAKSNSASNSKSKSNSDPGSKFGAGPPRYLIFSGGSGKLTRDRFSKPEAEVFADIARKMGVPDEKILVEPLSTNTGENVRFTYALLRERGLLGGLRPERERDNSRMETGIKCLVLVQKPYMERRTYATFVKQWPGSIEDGNGEEHDEGRYEAKEKVRGGKVEILVTSPKLTWAEYPNEDNPRDLVINVAVGDLVRIREYPKKGFQIHQHIPDHVWGAAQRLIRRGYDSHLP